MSVGVDFNQPSASHQSVISILAYYILPFPAVALCIRGANTKYTNCQFSMKAVSGHCLADTVRSLLYRLRVDGLDVTLHKRLPLFSGRHHSLHSGRFLERLPASVCQATAFHLTGEAKANSDVSQRPAFANNNLVFDDVAVRGDATRYNPL